MKYDPETMALIPGSAKEDPDSLLIVATTENEERRYVMASDIKVTAKTITLTGCRAMPKGINLETMTLDTQEIWKLYNEAAILPGNINIPQTMDVTLIDIPAIATEKDWRDRIDDLLEEFHKANAADRRKIEEKLKEINRQRRQQKEDQKQ